MPAQVRANFIFGGHEIVIPGKVPKDWQTRFREAGFRWIHGVYFIRGLDRTTERRAREQADRYNNRETLAA